jgi:hypothetical protein
MKYCGRWHSATIILTGCAKVVDAGYVGSANGMTKSIVRICTANASVCLLTPAFHPDMQLDVKQFAACVIAFGYFPSLKTEKGSAAER